MQFLLFFLLLLWILLFILLQFLIGSCGVTLDYVDDVSGKTLYSEVLVSSTTKLVMGCREEGSRVTIVAAPADTAMQFDREQSASTSGGVELMSQSTTESRFQATIRAKGECKAGELKLPAQKRSGDPFYRQCEVRIALKPVRIAVNSQHRDTFQPSIGWSSGAIGPALSGPPERTGYKISHGDMLDIRPFMSADTQIDEAKIRFAKGRYAAGKKRWSSVIENRNTDTPYVIYAGRKPDPRTITAVHFEVSHKDCPSADFLEECSAGQQLILINSKDYQQYFEWSHDTLFHNGWLQWLPSPPQKICTDALTDPEYIGALRDMGWDEPTAISTDHPNYYHQGASYEMRSLPYGLAGMQNKCIYGISCYGHQATYDGDGDLIMGGIGAGSADRGAPFVLNLWSHANQDVRAWLVAAWLDGNATHAAGHWRQVFRLVTGNYVSRLKNLSDPLIHEGEHLTRYMDRRPAVIEGFVRDGPSCD